MQSTAVLRSGNVVSFGTFCSLSWSPLGTFLLKNAQLCIVKKHEQFFTAAWWSLKRQAAGYSRAKYLYSKTHFTPTIDGHSM